MTSKSVDQIKQVLQAALKGADLSPIQSSTGGLLDAGPQAAVELLAEKKGLGGVGSIQVYVFESAQRQVKIVALGDGGMSRAFGGVKNTASLGKSVKMAEQVLAAIGS